MSGFTNSEARAILDDRLDGALLILSTTVPDADGGNLTEPTGAWYEPKAVPWEAAETDDGDITTKANDAIVEYDEVGEGDEQDPPHDRLVGAALVRNGGEGGEEGEGGEGMIMTGALTVPVLIKEGTIIRFQPAKIVAEMQRTG